jgi:diguanylate cyclase (GGDEF)-like protein
MENRPNVPRTVFAAACALTALFAACALAATAGAPLPDRLSPTLSTAAGLAAAAALLLHAAHAGRDRRAWLLVGAGACCWAVGNAAAALGLVAAGTLADPSPAAPLLLALYPLACAGMALLGRRRLRHLGPSLLLDALATMAAATALLVAFVLHVPVSAADRLSPGLLVTLALPVGDLLLVVVASGWIVLVRHGSQRAAAAGVLAALLFLVSDSAVALASADGGRALGAPLDAGWLVGLLFAAHAARTWRPAPARRAAGALEGDTLWAVPLTAALLAVGVLFADLFTAIPPAAEAVAVLALLLVVARAATTLRENRAMLRRLHREATTDALTGLGNRRRLFADLDDALAGGGLAGAASAGGAPGDDRPGGIALVAFDLDGFKTYNDTFGHEAGDRLLRRIADRLVVALGSAGRAYRLGGDEFCALVVADGAPELAERLALELTQRGDGFEVTASHGCAVALPDGDDANALLRHADRLMYERKHRRRPSAASQAVDALLAVVGERHPSLAGHVAGVSGLARQVAERLGLPAEEVDAVAHAASLHDVGKVAIPDALLHRAGPLDAEEWSFMRQHTIVGERVLLAVPALRAAAPLVRASHERWDGSGYPDGLRGEQIPLGAAVIAACDAFDAMTEERCYQPARSESDALAELVRCSGTQFAPRVVEALVEVATSCRSGTSGDAGARELADAAPGARAFADAASGAGAVPVAVAPPQRASARAEVRTPALSSSSAAHT